MRPFPTVGALAGKAACTCRRTLVERLIGIRLTWQATGKYKFLAEICGLSPNRKSFVVLANPCCQRSRRFGIDRMSDSRRKQFSSPKYPAYWSLFLDDLVESWNFVTGGVCFLNRAATVIVRVSNRQTSRTRLLTRAARSNVTSSPNSKSMRVLGCCARRRFARLVHIRHRHVGIRPWRGRRLGRVEAAHRLPSFHRRR